MVKEEIDAVFNGIYKILMFPVDACILVINKVGVQRAMALSSGLCYLYMEILQIPVPPGLFAFVMGLNGLHAAKSIYGKGVETGINNQKKE